jgi:DNA repair exonuclease SbcCD ATPase subunit
VNTLEKFAKDLCRCVWSEADAIMNSDGPVAAARNEIDRLKAKLTECNLSAMKEMNAAKAGAHNWTDLGSDTITFHEPLQYLDSDTKSLVLNIVCDKVRQLENSTAPPSLVQALEQHAHAQANPADTASMEELRETRAELEDARIELRKARLRMEEAEDLSRQFEVRLKASEDRAHALEQELTETKALLARSEAKLAEAEHALVELRAEHLALQTAHKQLQVLSVQQKAEIVRLGCELAKEREANEFLRKEVERLQEFVRRAQQLENELKVLQTRFDELEAEADAMREELARRNNTRTKGTQTTMTGSKLDEKSAETRKLKLMLEELQTKMKELMQECRRKYGDISSIVESLGLKELLKEETVFQRLYDDAVERVHRLEKLRSRIRKERRELWPNPGSPRAMAAETCAASPEIPVVQAVEDHQPSVCVQNLLEERTASNLASKSVKPRCDQGCGEGFLGEDVWSRSAGTQKVCDSGSVLKSSTSLPSLPKAMQSNVALVNLNIGCARRGSKGYNL